jgi:hypothetical protein
LNCCWLKFLRNVSLTLVSIVLRIVLRSSNPNSVHMTPRTESFLYHPVMRGDFERMARRRFQRGSVFLRGTRELVWVGRWREDVIELSGKLVRIRKTEVLGTKKDLPTKKLALRELGLRLAPINSGTYRALRVATFAEFADLWKRSVLTQHKPATQSAVIVARSLNGS